jgi:hypothetical protein
MLIIPVGCVDIEFSGNKGPYTYETSEGVSISWHLDYYPSKLKSYELCVSPVDKKDEKKWNDSVVLNDASPGEHSPIDRSINLGKMAEGVYFAAFTSEPNDNFPPIDDHGIFVVTPSKGSIEIASFYEMNGKREGHEGTKFQMTGPKGLVFNADTGPEGIATISVPTGQYTITESPRDCWRSLTGMSQIVTVLEGQKSSVVFKDEPDTGYTIFGYNSSTRNGIAGFTFTVSGPEGPQTLVSGSDGFARPSRIGLPGTYTVIAAPPTGMEMATPSRIEFDPCKQKQIDFGANKIKPPFFWIAGSITQLREWLLAHGEDTVLLIPLIILLLILGLIIKYRRTILKYWRDILKSTIVGYIVAELKIILSSIWLFLQTSFGFCFSITYGLSLAVIEINPKLAQLITYQIPLYILYGVISLAVTIILTTMYTRFNPKKQYHSMAYTSIDPYAYSYLDNPKAKGPAKVLWKWYSPDGELYEARSFDIDQDTVSCHCPIQIAGKSAANLTGIWHVDIFIDEKKILTERFILLDK